jgi:hypothetical protein
LCHFKFLTMIIARTVRAGAALRSSSDQKMQLRLRNTDKNFPIVVIWIQEQIECVSRSKHWWMLPKHHLKKNHFMQKASQTQIFAKTCAETKIFMKTIAKTKDKNCFAKNFLEK